jgi:hypothetical protein
MAYQVEWQMTKVLSNSLYLKSESNHIGKTFPLA